ncbi:MAG: RnfABCDGE type electron transport complex subunit G [Rikenellaceae bacterium]
MKNSLKNMILSLFAITFASAVVVGAVFQTTKEPIEKNRIKAANEALRKVLPDFDNDAISNPVEKVMEKERVYLYTAKKGEQIVGYAVQTFTKEGYGGKFTLMVGFTPEGEIIKIETLDHQETAGLGDKIQNDKSDYNKQFIGLDLGSKKAALKADKGEIDAISGSTVSSKAYIDAVNRAYTVFELLK